LKHFDKFDKEKELSKQHTAQRIKEIRQLKSNGMNILTIAAKFGVSRSSINRWISGEVSNVRR